MYKFLFKRVDNSALVLFRMVWGFLIMCEGWVALLTGWVKETFVDPNFTFTWYGFEWTNCLLGYPMYLIYFLIGLSGLLLILGYFYRMSAVAFAILWTLVFFMQKSHYNNHYYLMFIIGWIMPLLSANTYASLDVGIRKQNKQLYCDRWEVLLLPFLMAIVYVYGAIAKMHPDWLSASPIDQWLSSKSNYFLIGPLLSKTWMHYFIAYGGLFFDLLIVPALLFKKTRTIAFFSSLIFHLFNSAVFSIGVFPYLGLSFAMFYWEPELIGKRFLRRKQFYHSNSNLYSTPKPLLASFLIFLCISQLLIPLRHQAIVGDVLWTEEGHRLSWRMMLRSRIGTGYFYYLNKDGLRSIVNLNDYLAPHQHQLPKSKPDCLYQFVQLIKNSKPDDMAQPPVIKCVLRVSVNGRASRQWVSDTTNLATIERNRLSHNNWILNRPDDWYKESTK